MIGLNGLNHSRARYRRANFMDLFLLIGMALFIGLSFLFGGYLLHIGETQIFNGSNFDNTTNSFIKTASSNYYSSFDYLFLVLFIGLGLVIIISSFLIRSSPVFIVFFLFGLIGLMFFAGLGQRIFSILIGVDELSVMSGLMPITTFVLNHLGVFIGVIAVISFVGLLTSSGGGEL